MSVTEDPPVEWMLGPGSVTWAVMRNPYVFAVGILREGLLNALSLPFATTTVEHDRTLLADPMMRFRHAAWWFFTAPYGTKEETERLSRVVRRRHAHMNGVEPVTGRPYAASSDELLVLCHALSWTSYLAAYESIHQPLASAERDQFLVEVATLSATVGLDPALVPLTWEDMTAYLAEQRQTYAVGEHARSLLIPFTTGRFPPGSYLGALPAWQRHLLAPVFRAVVDLAVATIPDPERSLLGIGRPAQLRSATAVRCSGRALAGLLARPATRDRFEAVIGGGVPEVMQRARAAESALGGPILAKRHFTLPQLSEVSVPPAR